MTGTTLPHLTAGTAGVAGVFKARWEDFRVTEVPAIEPEGTGDHLWVEIEKRGLATPRAASDLARALGVKPSSVGYAGMKDARAIARQWMSVEHVEPERARRLDIPRIRVLRAVRHPRKLRRGWHRGNRFEVLVRPADPPGSEEATSTPDHAAAWGPAAMHDVRAVLDLLGRDGVPNYYGPQRFGSRGDTWRVGRALARGEWEEAAALIAGRPLPAGDARVDPAAGVFPDAGDVLRARELYDAGEYEAATDAWPRGFGQCVRLARAMARTGDAERALPVVGKRMLRLYASAYQSWLFNEVLAERIRAGTLASLLMGDLAWKHDSEALFPVGDPAGEQSRADAFEISPTGPLVGRKMRSPEGEAAELERRVLARAGFDPGVLESRAMRPLTGRRRPLRFRLADTAVDTASDGWGPYLELRFTLPPGCYATALLRELGKGGIREGPPGGVAGGDGIGVSRPRPGTPGS